MFRDHHDVFRKDTTTRRWVLADSSAPLVTSRSSSEHGLAAAGVDGAGAAAGLDEPQALVATPKVISQTVDATGLVEIR
jgi:hypothetical protein